MIFSPEHPPQDRCGSFQPSCVRKMLLIQRRSRHALFTSAALAAALLVAGCGDSKPPSHAEQMQKEMYPFGSILGGEGGINLFGKNKKTGEGDGAGIGVNSFLWRASLDTLAFMPIVQADPFGGVILTDWYTPSDSPSERFKVNLYILDRQLRADGVRVSVFRQQKAGADWRDAPVAGNTAATLEDSILTRARQLRLAQQARGGE